MSRRTVLTTLGAVGAASIAGCSDRVPSRTTESSDPERSVFADISFAGPDLVVSLAPDHDVQQLTLYGPEGERFERTGVASGARQATLQLLFISGGSYTAGEYELVATTDRSSESMALPLRPDVQIVSVTPQTAADDGHSTGRLFVTVTNAGTGPTWIYNIGFPDAPYSNAPAVIEGEGVADTTFEKPEEPSDEFLTPGARRTFLKTRGVLVVSNGDSISCDGDTTTVTVVVQTPHGDIKQSIRAQLSGGYHIEDQGAIQHPCKNVEIELLNGGEQGA